MSEPLGQSSAGFPRWKPVLVAGLAGALVLFIGGTITDIGPWYHSLRKPSWQPPDWLFGPAWTVIFILVTLAAAKAWQGAGGRENRHWVLGLFALNGFLNIMWSVFFFRLQRPDWALLEVALLWLSILMLIVFFWRRTQAASLLLTPYLAWVSFAAALNLAVVMLNGAGAAHVS
ncbi:TspO and MBR like protein [Methylocella silvestris BL2]|uniref:TspO and MBR like protein n=1 Tax=Methylocella silvestris (strain DSM 15510 / CIP 108128 / LMG 27833 / NCIMB 13906 / BL2) TaxID=395965 RepID=B8EQ00_METSB|nr:TspO/MBR family protein [Methylocella silvestris]ACK51004.1 TspO and MBR like protein [Methylocella silvestris BL2]